MEHVAEIVALRGDHQTTIDIKKPERDMPASQFLRYVAGRCLDAATDIEAHNLPNPSGPVS